MIPTLTSLRFVTATGLAALALPVSAQMLEVRPQAHVQVQQDNNLFRAPDTPGAGSAPRTRDTVVIYGAGARLTMRHSLQTLEVQGTFDRHNYSDQNQLDHDSHRLEANARLNAGSTLHLDANATRQKRLENFAFRDDAQKGFITASTATATLGYDITPRWTLQAGGSHLATAATLATSAEFDLRENGVELGARYARTGYSSLGVSYKEVAGEYPKRVVTPGDGREKDYRQRTLSGVVGYTPSGLSDLSARVGYTERTHNDASVSDFRGLTGRLSYTRQVSGRTRLRADAYRDLFYVEEVGANFAENLGLVLAADYRYSAKLSIAAALESVDSDYRGASRFTATSGDPRSDDQLTLRLGADYRPVRGISLLPEYRWERRQSNIANSGYAFSSFGLDITYEYGARLR